jgi:predicted metal-dependent hydrolase
MASNRTVGYVLVHDYLPVFWKAVGRYMSDYLECKEWLKLNANGLEV